MAPQNFMQNKIAYKWRDVWNFFQCFDCLLERLTSKLFEIVRIRCFEHVPQNRTNSQTLPVSLVEWSQHQFKLIDRTDANFVEIKERSQKVLHANFGGRPWVVFEASREKQRLNDRQLDLWNGLSVQLVK